MGMTSSDLDKRSFRTDRRWRRQSFKSEQRLVNTGFKNKSTKRVEGIFHDLLEEIMISLVKMFIEDDPSVQLLTDLLCLNNKLQREGSKSSFMIRQSWL